MPTTTTTTTTVAPSLGPCSWPVVYPAGVNKEYMLGLPAADQIRVTRMAIDYLWNWTGRKFGLCPVSVRPCRVGSCATTSAASSTSLLASSCGSPWMPVLIAGEWYNIECGSCGVTCGCTAGAPALQLPYPVYSIESVVIDGVVLAASSYRLEEKKFLIRQDGSVWPTCQDMDAVLGTTNTWSVNFTWGVPVPVGGQVATGLLALEFAKALSNDKTCQLPQRWQTITRQGVSITTQDLFEDLDKGHTGIWLIDSWVTSVMSARPSGGRVYSPDTYKRYRLT